MVCESLINVSMSILSLTETLGVTRVGSKWVSVAVYEIPTTILTPSIVPLFSILFAFRYVDFFKYMSVDPDKRRRCYFCGTLFQYLATVAHMRRTIAISRFRCRLWNVLFSSRFNCRPHEQKGACGKRIIKNCPLSIVWGQLHWTEEASSASRTSP